MKRHNNLELGPAMDEDVLLLQAIIRMTTPLTVVEFGHFWGKSAWAMLEVMRPDAVLHSFDNTKDATSKDPRFKFYKKSQDEIEGITDIDFVFIDASHDFEINKRTFEYLMEHMAHKGIIAVHDTGTWVGGNVFEAEAGFSDGKGNWIHCPDELKFVDWVKDTYPEWQEIHFHSSRDVRHGITLLQKYNRLVL